MSAEQISRWYVVVTYGRDYQVRDALKPPPEKRWLSPIEGIDVWLPECRVRRVARRAIITIKGPLFPGYVFVRMSLTAERQRLIEEIRDVDHLMQINGELVSVPEAEMCLLQKLVAESGGNILIDRGVVIRKYATPAAAEPFERGQQIRVTDGLWGGFLGLYEMPDANDRIKVFLDIFGRRTLVSLAEALAEPA